MGLRFDMSSAFSIHSKELQHILHSSFACMRIRYQPEWHVC
jgi:hypothetical protein